MISYNLALLKVLVAGTALVASSFLTFTVKAAETEPDVFMQPFPSATAEDKFNHSLGRSLFEKFWIPAPSSTTASDGLGPLFNARSCHSCHLNNGKGHAPIAGQDSASVPSFFLRLKRWPTSIDKIITKAVEADPIYGAQLQSNALPNIAAEMRMHIEYEFHTVTFKDESEVELRKPIYKIDTLNYGPLHKDTVFSGRVSPALVGVGLLDAVDDETLLALADPDDKDQDGISGKVNKVWDITQQKWRPGRFGWKATVATLTEQNQSAFNGDLGISTPLFPNPNGDCSQFQIACLKQPNGNSAHTDNLEAGHIVVNMLDSFTALSAPPKMRNLGSDRFMAGKHIFDTLNCGSCHIASLETGKKSVFPELHNQTFYAFTDLLLHDMGAGLADIGKEFDAEGAEWRTAPLWGLSLNKQVAKRESYLHDGRASSIEEAILWHGGEAQKSQTQYRQLSSTERSLLIEFLESL